LTTQEVVDKRSPSLATLKISGGKGLTNLFQTHPPLEKRIAVLEGRAS
jgi:Zn-dependent protease with chaperone function